ncbi:MAG TPA: hypothetical protein VGM03_20560, partial [Phycisphaerae bacterium]
DDFGLALAGGRGWFGAAGRLGLRGKLARVAVGDLLGLLRAMILAGARPRRGRFTCGARDGHSQQRGQRQCFAPP